MRDIQRPFQMRGNDIGILLIHGFTGSPADMRTTGEHLHAHGGWTIHAPLLPGHATRPEDLNSLRWQDWFAAVRHEYHLLRKRCPRVFAAGLSMGGALALHLASHYPLEGVVTLSTGLRPRDWRIPLVPYLKYFLAFDKKRDGEDIKDPQAKAAFAGYDVWPTWGVHELLKLNNHVREDLPEISCPLLVMHAREDHTVPVSDASIIHDESGARHKRLVLLDHSYHVITVDYDKEKVQSEMARFVDDVLDGVERDRHHSEAA